MNKFAGTLPPNRHLVALITFVALVPLVYFIPDLIAHSVPGGKLLHVALAVGIIVPIISYIVMPLSMKLLLMKNSDRILD